MKLLIVIGVALLIITYLDYSKSETDTIFLLDWWIWWDVSRASFPLLFWLILLIQTIVGVFLIYLGLTE